MQCYPNLPVTLQPFLLFVCNLCILHLNTAFCSKFRLPNEQSAASCSLSLKVSLPEPRSQCNQIDVFGLLLLQNKTASVSSPHLATNKFACNKAEHNLQFKKAMSMLIWFEKSSLKTIDTLTADDAVEIV